MQLLIAFYAVLLGWWGCLFFSGAVGTPANYAFALCFGLLPIMGSIVGMVNYRKWGSFGSYVGRAILFISLGLLTWGLGQLIFSYYNLFLDVEVPYPSLADASFILSWPLWGIGIFYLSKATGAKFGLRSTSGKLGFFAIPLLVIAASYYFLVVVARGGVLVGSEGFAKLFFDFAYPIGSVVLLTAVALMYSLSFKYLGGKFKPAIYLILIGFVINYFADFSFSYTTTVETFFSGNWVDMTFATAMLMLSLGVALLDPALLKVVNPPTDE